MDLSLASLGLGYYLSMGYNIAKFVHWPHHILAYCDYSRVIRVLLSALLVTTVLLYYCTTRTDLLVDSVDYHRTALAYLM